MSLIEEKIKKPSDFVTVVADALEHFVKEKPFKLALSSFGYWDEKQELCYGCIATCAIFHLANVPVTKDNICKPAHPDLGNAQRRNTFEIYVDCFRRGGNTAPFSFLNINYSSIPIEGRAFIESYPLPRIDGHPSDESLLVAVSVYRDFSSALQKYNL